MKRYEDLNNGDQAIDQPLDYVLLEDQTMADRVECLICGLALIALSVASVLGFIVWLLV